MTRGAHKLLYWCTLDGYTGVCIYMSLVSILEMEQQRSVFAERERERANLFLPLCVCLYMEDY